MDEDTADRIAGFIEPLRVVPGAEIELGRDFDPADTAPFASQDDSQGLLERGVELLSDYQSRLAAQDEHGVLLVLQALDAGGKDSTIRHVMSGVNPQGVMVHSFKAPSAEELDHDFLWRYAQRLPARGMIAIFNRSHYEEVVVVRVHPEHLTRQKLPAFAKGGDVWQRRYRQINDWERYLVENGIRVVKLFLNLSKDEQRRRFLKRIDVADKNWKFNAKDIVERERWDDYQSAFSAMLSATSTEWAPWYVIPADHKWYARVAAAAVVVHTLADIDPGYPVVSDDARRGLAAAKRWLEAEAANSSSAHEGAGTAAEALRR